MASRLIKNLTFILIFLLVPLSAQGDDNQVPKGYQDFTQSLADRPVNSSSPGNVFSLTDISLTDLSLNDLSLNDQDAAPNVWPKVPLTFDPIFNGQIDQQPGLSITNKRPAGSNQVILINKFYQINSLNSLDIQASEPKNPLPAQTLNSFDKTRLSTGLVGSSLFLDDRLTLSGGLTWDRSLYEQFGAQIDQTPNFTFDTMTYGFGADLRLNPQWSLGATITARETSDLTRSRFKASLREGFPFTPITPSDFVMSQIGLQFFNADWGLRARISAYSGQITPSSEPNSDYASSAPVDLSGVELNFKKSLIQDSLNLEVATMLNYLQARNRLDNHFRYFNGQNISAYLGLNFTDPTLFNASLLLRYAGDGNFVNNYFLTALGATSLLDARIWRDFNLSPVLTLSTQLYGSSLIETYYRNLAGQNPSAPYLEGRVTMSYSF
ncbi:MAG: hypothetical protein LBE31_10945 [Deltaproteobacteria bacterium]|jgi:hypothetical protein|nr:hypothetical protein [Deltaproteobacteria bacterium]